MTELEMKIEEVEADEFTDELGDEALDRTEGAYSVPGATNSWTGCARAAAVR